MVKRDFFNSKEFYKEMQDIFGKVYETNDKAWARQKLNGLEQAFKLHNKPYLSFKYRKAKEFF
jgi:hypothetical protein